MSPSRYKIGLVTTGVASIGALAFAGYLLFTDVTSIDGTAATALEAGNVVLISLAVLPGIVCIVCLLSAYRREGTPLWVGSGLLLIVGVLGVAVGPQLLGLGILLLLSAFLISSSGDETPESAQSV